MDAAQPFPTRREIDVWITAVLAGTRTRDEADRWAAQWHRASAGGVEDEVAWWALDLLHGIDMPAGPDGTFIHDDDQVRQWLSEFRRRCGLTPLR
ncbi:hypothetical protein GCM10010435_25350 [Winogradskya consettensis]|uniref:Uncharacterized protein n=1 Tax=Winogradskya consettensis TaxID=113560 RepID=A0A919VLH7_9ACTN|nr:hypothetical protein [Actinoplanes consettensis]GIM67855.1 hypothetical protein Aco04nite_08140 [Actinoplanes consettensis]